MGIRETLNQNPSITTGATIGIIVLALGFIVYQLIGGGEGGTVITQMYYSTDDGKTYFADEADKISPFDHNGAQAVRTYVFTCDDRKTEFVAYMERLTPDVKKKVEEARAKSAAGPNSGPGGGPPMEADFMMMDGMEVKKPGEANWVKRNSPEGEKVTMVTCPEGKTDQLNIVLPED